MTIEEAKEVIEQDIPCEYDVDLIDALNMAIASLEAWERVKDDIHEYETDCMVSADCQGCKDCNVAMFKSIYYIIDKHLQEIKNG